MFQQIEFVGEFDVDIQTTPYKDYTQADWALEWISMYSQIDGSHHKQWCLDQVARILTGTKVIVKLAKWNNGHTELRYYLDSPSEQYETFVKKMKGEYGPEYDEYEYDYDTGIAP